MKKLFKNFTLIDGNGNEPVKNAYKVIEGEKISEVGAGEYGGKVVDIGTLDKIKKNKESLTGLYLSGKYKIEPRKNYIIRKSANLSRESHIIASNIDTAYLVTTIDFPEVKPAFIDRFLVTCEAYRVPVKIVLNKRDLISGESEDKLEYFKDIYTKAGYEIIETSVKTGLNIDKIKNECMNRVSLFSGQSGVGKSSLISAMDPELVLKTADISDYHLQGKHTTTFYEMHPLSSGGFIIDTPGIRGFGLVEMGKEELSHYFPEMLRLYEECRFTPCTHTHEPGCRIKEAVERGEISPERYFSYIGMLEEEEKYR